MLIVFDLIVLLFLFIAFIKGYRKGLISMIISLATIIIATVFGGKIAEWIYPHLIDTINISPQWTNILAYTFAFLLIAFALTLVGKIVQNLFEAIYLGVINRILGALISISTTMIILSLITNLLLVVDFKERIITPELKKESFFYDRIQVIVPTITPFLNFEYIEDIIPENLNNSKAESNNSLPA